MPEDLAYLASYYRREDQSPFALFHRFRHYGYSFEHIRRQIKDSNAFLVGISSMFTAYSDTALSVAQIAKECLPESTVVLGGHHPTALPKEVMSEPFVDMVLRGEGELSLPKLAAALKSGSSLAEVPGIVFRNPDGSLFISEPTVVDELDKVPFPAFSLIRRSFYQRFGKDSISITASRGCPMACSYCATGKNSWMKFRKRSAESVIDEIRFFKKRRQVGFINFEDENLTIDQKWFLELMKGIQHLFFDNLPELRAMNGLFPPTLSETVVRAMKATGFKTLNLSLGSADSKQLARFNRPDVRDAFDRALELARKKSLSAVGYIIVGAPGQDPVSSVEDLLFLARRHVLCGVSVFYPAPGSADYKRCRDLGILPNSFSAMRATALPIDHRTSRTDSVTLLRLGRILNFIKSIVSAGQSLPFHEPGRELIDPNLPRQQKGLQLLASFLNDGVIRGIEPDGTVYRQRTSTRLCRQFLEGLRKEPIAGE